MGKIELSNIITLDFETYYSTEYSMSKPTYNTSAYVRDSQFHVHCCAVKLGKKKSKCYPGKELKVVFADIDWKNSALLAHNTAFDGFILAERYGIVPAFYYDTLSMTRALHGELSRASLDTIAKLYQLGAKHEGALESTKNKRELSFDELKRLMHYCNNDNELCWNVFLKQIVVFPEAELELIDLVVRMFCNSPLQVDLDMARKALAEEMIARRSEILKSGATEEELQSNAKFAQRLRELEVEPPEKISLKTGHINYALAQTDPEFLELLEHEDARVVRLAKGRLAAKSQQAETRASRLIQAGETGCLPVGYNYSAAKTHRFGGTNKLNLQNLPRVNKKEPKPSDGLRRSIVAPPGHVLVVVDSAQIEARTNAWLHDQTDLVNLFAAGEDVYSHMAADIYGVPRAKVTANQRFVGKVCLAEGTLIYSNRGWVEIQTLRDSDLLWDGEHWVCHQGLLNNGCKTTLNLCGLWLTPDHLVWSGTQWLEAQYLAQDENILYRALASAADIWSSQGILEALAEASKRSSSSATAIDQSTRLQSLISEFLGALAAIFAQSKRLLKNIIGATQKLCLTTHTALASSTDSQQLSRAVTRPQAVTTSLMERGESKYAPHGEKTERHFLSTSRHWKDGTSQNSKWIASTIIKDMPPKISALSVVQQMLKINDKSQILKRQSLVYDVLSVGPKNRFFALTSKGPLLVHNCVLGLGYSMGATKFQTTLALGIMGPPVELEALTCQRIVNLYRGRNRRITMGWDYCRNILGRMARGQVGPMYDGLLEFEPNTIWLPNGLPLHYPGLTQTENGEFRFKSHGVWKKIYGGLLVENIVQALARCIVMEQVLDWHHWNKSLKLRKNEVARICMTTHDEGVNCVPERLAEKALAEGLMLFRTAPSWAEGLPLDAEGSYDSRYSK